MPKKYKVDWKKGSEPKDITKRYMKALPTKVYEGFEDYVKDTAGDVDKWPVRTGHSRDAFEVRGDTLVGATYAEAVSERNDDLLTRIWDSIDIKEYERDAIKEVR